MTDLNLENRTTLLTDAEFDLIERNEEGRILGDFDLTYIWTTPSQRERLHDDDWSRGQELEDELRIMAAEFA